MITISLSGERCRGCRVDLHFDTFRSFRYLQDSFGETGQLLADMEIRNMEINIE